MRRLFSTFARGWPGVGLFLLRLVAGIALIAHSLPALEGSPPFWPAAWDVLMTAAGLLLMAGLWTPVAGTLAAAICLWNVFSQPGDPWLSVMMAALGAALALLGPGAWSVDARLFGWKRIDLGDRKS